MFKRYCDSCEKEVGLRFLDKANEPGTVIFDGIYNVGTTGIDVQVRCLAYINNGTGGSDICSNCAILAIKEAITGKPNLPTTKSTTKKKQKK